MSTQTAHETKWKAYFRAERADDAWGVELKRTFGRRAGDARYRPEGRGTEGTALRTTYDERTAAWFAYWGH